ncbi:MAG TPA: hypothetical protein VNO30_29790 [Kofleriaceae bacterium]|nr:hypothetical protein [Kofleriaceae bacterium]
MSAGLLPACDVPLEHYERVDAAPDVDASPDASPPPFVPSHVLPETMMGGAPDLVLSASSTSIDTTTLMIDGSPTPYLVRQGDYAILFAGSFSVPNPVTVTGTSPLIVVASGQVIISARVALGASGRVPGPGAATGGSGGGGAGQSVYNVPANVRISSGGGGASYGTLGASGGGTYAPAGGAGVRYGDQLADPLVGGSKGGAGGFCGPGGGAGGGALQISSAVSISVGPGGLIEAGGGGGGGGGGGPCGGGGGGSGGEIVLEAPSIAVAGRLAANGGGGGGGGGNGGGSAPLGLDGQDGTASAMPAAGGAGGIPMGSDGGAGAAGAAGAFVEARSGGTQNSEGGGGGGGAGRIWLRYRAAIPPDLTGAVISPPISIDPTLP